MHRFVGALALGALLWPGAPRAADEVAPNHRPVDAVGDRRVAVGDATLPLYASADWEVSQPSITRAVIVLHGRLRNADVYYESALKAQAAAGAVGRSTLMLVPQFLAQVDVDAFHLPPSTLRWTWEGWEGGDDAVGPAPISSFAGLDAILLRLADRSRFPNLRIVVVAGHSGGAQVVQRYAIAAKAVATLTADGIAVRFVVANPSSYAYFSPERPSPAIASSCPGYNDWKYGMEARAPYLAGPNAAALEADYVARDVVYLLGTLDTNPQHPALDRTCMAEAQGPYRYARGHAYFAAMQARDGGTPHHRLFDVPGVGHDGDKMLTSACGLAALFDSNGCPE